MRGMWVAFGFIIAGSIFLVWLYTSSTPEDIDGVTLYRGGRFNWNYKLEDRRGMWGIGYLSRGSALRAARAELQRLQERDKA